MEGLSRRERERLMREQDILAAARKVMCLKGFEAASMDEIGKEAQFTKRTLYQYFENKEDLFFAVVLAVFREMHQYLKENMDYSKNGMGKIRDFCNYYYRFFMKDEKIMQLIGHIGYVRSRSSQESKRLKEFLDFNNLLFQEVSEVLAEGIADGSIKSSFKPMQTAFSLLFLLIGFFNQLSMSGKSFTSHFSMSMDEFTSNTVELILKSLENNLNEIFD